MTIEQVNEVIDVAIKEAEGNRDFGGGEIVSQAVEVVRHTLGISCTYKNCGGFDSTGYDITCYAIAYVTKDGKLGIYAYEHEVY